MFRLTHYLRLLGEYGDRKPAAGKHMGTGPIVIWNLTRTCNLQCVHCYSSSKNRDYASELSTGEAMKVLDDLKDTGVFSVIFSGGEPLFRKDLFELAGRAKELGLFLTLSTNGTMIDEGTADRIAEAGFDYVGVSLDGIKEVHDRFRGMEGSFDEAAKGLLNCKERGVRVGVRFTMTRMNGKDLPSIFSFVEKNGIDKLYLSHLVYSGRGSANCSEDLSPSETRRMMENVFMKAEGYVNSGSPIEIVTGNNEADAVLLLLRTMESHPAGMHRLLPLLKRWGGNSAGRGIANIDSRGDVHPDPLMSGITLGNVREAAFSRIWYENDNMVHRRLRERPRRLNGRCGNCVWLEVCNGANRTRAQRKTGDMWSSDPACYISDAEIGLWDDIESTAVKPSLIYNH